MIININAQNNDYRNQYNNSYLIGRFGFKMHEPNGEGLKDKKVALLVVVKDQMKTIAFQVLADLILAPQDFLDPKMQRLEVLLLLHPIARVQ